MLDVVCCVETEGRGTVQSLMVVISQLLDLLAASVAYYRWVVSQEDSVRVEFGVIAAR